MALGRAHNSTKVADIPKLLLFNQHWVTIILQCRRWQYPK